MTEYSHVNFFVGVNGSGKSRLLNSIGQKYLGQNRSVLAISNTVFDKFNQKGYKKLSSRAGKTFLKKTIIDSILSENNKVYNILEYLGYAKELGILISFYSGFDGDFFTYFTKSIDKYNKDKVPDEDGYIDYNLNELNLFCNNLKLFLHKFENDDYFFDLGYWGLLDRNLKSFPIFRKLYELFANKKIIKIDFLLFKDGNRFKLDGASSGESHFLAQMLFLDNCLNKDEKNIILIDEPEISLHPKWQREYIFQLYNYFYMYDLKIFIATHSPLLMSKIRANQEALYDDYIGHISHKVFKVSNQNSTAIEEDDDYSIESLYWEVFGILTPDNSFLSRHCVKLLDQLQEHKLSYKFVEQEFIRLIESADNSSQKEVLKDIKTRFLTKG